MAIRTQIAIGVDIDEVVYKVTVQERTTKEKQNEIDKLLQDQEEIYAQRDSIQLELDEAVQDFNINVHILEGGELIDRVATAFEQKRLRLKISNLKNKLSEASKNLTSMSDSMELILEKRFDLTVFGKDKEALKKVLKEKNVTYQMLWNDIFTTIKDAKEKKSKTSSNSSRKEKTSDSEQL